MVFPIYKFFNGNENIVAKQVIKEDNVNVTIKYGTMSNKMEIAVGNYIHS